MGFCRVLVVLLLVGCAAIVVPSTTSIHGLKNWAINRVPGQIGDDLRAVNAAVTWDRIDYGNTTSSKGGIYLPTNLTFVNLTVHGGDLGEPTLRIQRLHIEFEPSFWRPLPLDVTLAVEGVSAVFKAYDVRLRDSNWARLGKSGFPPSFATSSTSSSTTSSVRVKSLRFAGALSLAVEPCDALGGSDLRADLTVDWEHGLRSMCDSIENAAKVAPEGALSPDALYEIIKELSIVTKVREALFDVLAASSKDGLKKPTGGGLVATLGGRPLTSLNQTRAYLETTVVATVKRHGRRLLSRLGLGERRTDRLEADLGTLFQKIAKEVKKQKAEKECSLTGEHCETSIAEAQVGDLEATDHAASLVLEPTGAPRPPDL